MHRICPVFCVFFFLFHGSSCSKFVKDGSTVTVECDPKQGTILWWFHVKESGPIEFLAYFSKGEWKAGLDKSKFANTGKTLTLDNFIKHENSGVYSCATFNANKLIFGEVTRLFGEPDPTTQKIPEPATTPAKTEDIGTTKPTVSCQKNSKAPKKIEASLGCELHVFIPLLSGCGLLLLLLLITILYCNRIRTRRCPHHYKRQPRSTPSGHKALPNPPGF